MKKYYILFFIISLLLILLTIFSMVHGSIEVTITDIINYIINNKDNKNVDLIYDLRLPRILISILAGGGLAVSGLLLQTSLKNPLLDPSIIGVSSGASAFLYLSIAISPLLISYKHLFSILGGVVGYTLIYIFARSTKNTVKIILIGIAISSFFTGLISTFQFLTSTSSSLSARATLSMKNWDDVKLLLIFIPILVLASWILSKYCNIFFLDDKIIYSLGVNVSLIRIILSLLAVIIASVITSVVGTVTFLALIIPHIAKIFVGKNHIYIIPFSFLLGAIIFLAFDTFGRIVFSPIEISADIIMLIIGAPIFLLLIRKGDKYE